MTRYEKITISLPSRAAETARQAVKDGRSSSVSAYIVEALEMQTKTDNWDELFEQMMEETGGPMQPWEERAADRALASSVSDLRLLAGQRRNALAAEPAG